jgi:hypothetical protein
MMMVIFTIGQVFGCGTDAAFIRYNLQQTVYLGYALIVRVLVVVNPSATDRKHLQSGGRN